MTHSEMDDLYELYLLGVLESEQAAEISEHLRQRCEYCQQQFSQSAEIVAALSQMAELTSPPPTLRKRVLSIATPMPIAAPRPGPKRLAWPLAFAFAAAASVCLLVWNINQSGRIQEVLRQRNELRSALAILSESDTRTVSFGQNQAEPQGRVFVSKSGGVVFLGNRLPQLQAGKTFEFWLIPAKGNPEPSGLFTTNSQGVAVNVLNKAIDPTNYAAVAVSIEPVGGSLQPTTKPILIVPLA